MKNRFLCALLCLCLTLILLPATALAADDITSTGLDLSTSTPTAITTYTAGTGTVVWNPTANPATLTFNGATVSVSNSDSLGAVRAFNLPADRAVKVIFNGANTITATAGASAAAFLCNNDTTFDLLADSNTTLSAIAKDAYGINLYPAPANSFVEIKGSGALQIDARCIVTSTAIAASGKAVKLSGGTLAFRSTGLYPIGVDADSVTLGGVTVLAGETLDLRAVASVTKGATGAAIYGALLLKDGTTQEAINALGLTGSGTVQLAEYNSITNNWDTTATYCYNGGQWQLAVPSTGLDLTTPPAAETTWFAGNGMVTYTPAAGSANARLVFNGVTISASTAPTGSDTVTAVKLPQNAAMDVIFKGTNEINATAQGGATKAVTFSAADNVTFTAEANSKTTLNAKGNDSKAIYSSGGDVAINGEGELLLAPTMNSGAPTTDDGYAIHAAGQTVTIDCGSVYEPRNNTDSTTAVISGTGGIRAGAVNLTADAIPVGSTLDLSGISGAANVTRGSGALLNNGTLILPSDTQASALNGMNITGSGVVKIGNSYYKNVNGTWMTDITNVGLDIMNNHPTEATTYAAGEGFVTYTPGANGNPPTLTLNNATIAPISSQPLLPANPPLVLDNAKLELVGSSSLKGTGVPAIGGAADNSDVPAGDITVGGSGSLLLEGKSNTLGSFGAARLTLEDAATVTSPSGTVSMAPVIGPNANLNAILNVNGTQTVYGKNTIAEGVNRLYNNEDLAWTPGAGMEVNGVLTLKQGTDFNSIKDKLSGSGIVRIVTEVDATGNATAWDSYRTDGTPMHAYPNGLNFALPAGENQGYWKEGATLADDGYTFTGSATDGYVLTLGDLDIFPNQSDIAALTLPDDGKVEVKLAGDTRIQNSGFAMWFQKDPQTQAEYPCIITGSGKLALLSDGNGLGCLGTSQPLTIAGGDITITNSGRNGIDAPDAALTISGGQLNITAKTSAVYASSLTLGGAAITSPAGATFDAAQKSIVGADGMAAAGVTISAVSSGGYYDPTVYNAKRSIWLTGSGLSYSDLLVTESNPTGSAYKAMLKLANGSEVFNTYNIYFKSGRKSIGSAMYLHFDLSAKYAGQAFTLVHQKADGAYEFFYATADGRGDLAFGPLYELSPFMLVKGTLSSSYGVTDLPKTGDNAQPVLWAGVALMSLLGLAATAYAIRRKRA